MAQADVIYNEAVKKIQTDGTWNKGQEVRAKYADGVLAHAKSIFGIQFEFRNGLMPLLTAKKVFSKTAAKEMMLFWVQQTVKQDDFERENCKVWDEWFFANRTLGRSYAYQFESRPKKEVVKVHPRMKEHHGELKPIIVGEKQEPNHSNTNEMIGKVFTSNKCGDAIVLDTFKSGTYYENSIAVKLQFLETGFITIVQKQDIARGRFVDKYARTVRGVGYKGDVSSVRNYQETEIRYLQDVWESMLDRCYNSSSVRYDRYGGRGVFVSERWHSFENFLRDIRWVPQFFLAKEQGFRKWELDKDYYASNCYSLDTCVWLESKENVLYSGSKGRPFTVELPNGEKELFIHTHRAALEYGVDHSSISKSLKSGKLLKGLKISYVQDTLLYRYELSSNQVVDLINNIKNNPSSRRLLTNFWNDADVKKKALQECAYGTEWNVRDGKLDLILIQRSGDIGLGVPFNWIQYWILLNMVAQVCGLEVGDFIHQMGNLHYYDRHEATLMEQIQAEQYELPTFKINTEVKDFFDFTHEDIQFINYQSGKFMPMEVAI